MDALAQLIEGDEQQLNRKGEVIGLGPDHAVRLRAATSVLDRTGMGPMSSTDVSVRASVHLMELIAQLDGEQDAVVLEGRTYREIAAAHGVCIELRGQARREVP